MSKDSSLNAIIGDLPQILNTLREYREIVIANAILLGEIPAPTFQEEQRIRFIIDRFTEMGLQHISTDEMGNGMAILPGHAKSNRNILLVSHADTLFSNSVDHSVSVAENELRGPGIADNSLGLAVISALPVLLEKLGMQLQSNLILLGASRSLGHGDLTGLRYFLDHLRMPVTAGICVAGVNLGRLSYSCPGMLRAEIVCRVPLETDWERSNSSGAIVNLNKILTAILNLPEAKTPRTSIILGSIAAGNAFNRVPTNSQLRFEVRSEKPGLVDEIRGKIEEIILQTTADTVAEAQLEIVARRRSGGIPEDHPLVDACRGVMTSLGIQPRVAPSVGDLAALLHKEIPSLTLGLTEGDHLHDFGESVKIEPIFVGLTQLIGLIRAIDVGLCDGN